VSDVAGRFSTEELAELSALADGTLPVEKRSEVEARIAASPELQELVERQRRSLLAMQALAAEDVPVSLQAAVEAQHPSERRRRRLLTSRLVLACAAVAAAIVSAVLLSGGPGAPSVADAARLATQAATAPAPARQGTSGTKLAIGVDGVSFPDFARAYGWRAAGVRQGRLDGRPVTVVLYRKDGRRLGYAIVAGGGLSRPGTGGARVIHGVTYQTLRVGGRPVVTWRRGGHTCVLIGQATYPELLKLASWPLTPPR
jgi:anti-sigma factor RsiW